MLEITNVKTYDIEESLIASGNAMRVQPCEYTAEEKEAALGRCKRLVQASVSGQVKSHDNFLTGCLVSFDLKYPQYISMELQRYHFLQIVSSSSKMHRILKMDFGKCCNEYVTDETKAQMQKLVSQYNGITEAEKAYDSPEQYKDVLYRQWMKIVSNCPMGLELFMRVTTNYKQLQTIYFQRRNHKLREWRTFCDWIKSLPYSEFITGEFPEEELDEAENSAEAEAWQEKRQKTFL